MVLYQSLVTQCRALINHQKFDNKSITIISVH